jgi:hypothetical protein
VAGGYGPLDAQGPIHERDIVPAEREGFAQSQAGVRQHEEQRRLQPGAAGLGHARERRELLIGQRSDGLPTFDRAHRVRALAAAPPGAERHVHFEEFIVDGVAQDHREGCADEADGVLRGARGRSVACGARGWAATHM